MRRFGKLVLMTAGAVLLAVQQSHGQQWLQTGDTNWSVGSNWTGGFPPTIDDDVEILVPDDIVDIHSQPAFARSVYVAGFGNAQEPRGIRVKDQTFEVAELLYLQTALLDNEPLTRLILNGNDTLFTVDVVLMEFASLLMNSGADMVVTDRLRVGVLGSPSSPKRSEIRARNPVSQVSTIAFNGLFLDPIALDNRGTIHSELGVLELITNTSRDVTFDLDGDESDGTAYGRLETATAGSIHVGAPLSDAFSGTIDIHGGIGGGITFDHPFTADADSQIFFRSSDDFPVFPSDPKFIDTPSGVYAGTIWLQAVTSNFDGEINPLYADLRGPTTLDGNIVVFEEQTTLTLRGPTTLDGAFLAEAAGVSDATLRQSNDITVVSNSVIATPIFDWGNSTVGTVHQITVNGAARLTITSEGTDHTDNRFHGQITVYGGAAQGGELEVGFDFPWRLAVPSGSLARDPSGGTLNLFNLLGGDGPTVSGTTLINFNQINVGGIGSSTIAAPLVQRGTVEVGSAAVLELTDVVTGDGNFTGDGEVRFHDVLSPGVSPFVPAPISFEGDVSFVSRNPRLSIGLAGVDPLDFDRLIVDGHLALNGFLDVNLLGNFELPLNQQFLIAEAGTRSGFFTGLDEGALVNNFNGIDLFITYTAGDGNDVALFTIPEPGTGLSVVIVLTLAATRRRRHHFNHE